MPDGGVDEEEGGREPCVAASVLHAGDDREDEASGKACGVALVHDLGNGTESDRSAGVSGERGA